MKPKIYTCEQCDTSNDYFGDSVDGICDGCGLHCKDGMLTPRNPIIEYKPQPYEADLKLCFPG